jgi:hypothetical protein
MSQYLYGIPDARMPCKKLGQEYLGKIMLVPGGSLRFTLSTATNVLRINEDRAIELEAPILSATAELNLRIESRLSVQD